MNRLAAALIVAAVVAGPPLLAAAWALQHPWRAPTRQQVNAWLERPLTAGTILVCLAAVVVVFWLLLVVYLTHRGIRRAAVGWRRLRRLPLPTPAQMTASSMAGVAAFTLPTVTVGHAAAVLPAAAGTPQPPPTSPDPTSAGTTLAAEPDDTRTEPGIELPGGGWIPYRTALAVAAAASLVWLRRRQHYRPGPPGRPRRDRDADLRPLPGTADTITAALADTPPPSADPQPVLVTDDLPAGVLHLRGPGAAAAARGLLVTAALADHAGAPVRVSVRSRDLAVLLPDLNPADLPAGIAATDRPQLPAGSPPTADDTGDDGAPGQGLILLIHRTSALDRDDTAPTGAETRTAVVIGGPAAAGPAWQIHLDGTATGAAPHPRRLCVLDQQAATDLLGLIRHTHRATADHTAPVLSLARHRQSAEPVDRLDPRPAAERPAARLRLLGGCRLIVHNQPVALRRTAGLQILAFLALHPDGATTTDLTSAVWPGLPASTITHRLHTTLSDLRKELHPLLGDDPITRHGDRYHLNHRVIDTDLTGVHAATRAITHAATADQRRTACQTLVDAYHGDLAADYAWPWLQPLREALHRDVLDAHQHLAATAPPDHAARLL